MKDKNIYVRSEAAGALGKFGDERVFPRKILAHTRLSAQEKIDVLDKLRRVRYKSFFRSLRYEFPDSRTLCQTVLTEEDDATRVGALEALNWLDRKELMRASQRVTAAEAQELLRPHEGNTETQPDTLLRASDEPELNILPSTAQPTLWQRLFGKRTKAT